jgi:hypothetical protein
MGRHKGLIALQIALLCSATQASDIAAQGTRDQSVFTRQSETSVPAQPFYPTEYTDLRLAARGYWSEFGPRRRSAVRLRDIGGGRFIELWDCVADDPMDEPLIDTGSNEDHFWLARRVERIRHVLRLFGYPPGSIEEPLIAYEQRMFEYFQLPSPPEPPEDAALDSPEQQAVLAHRRRGDALLERLAADINARRNALGVRAPPVGIEAGCGAGYFPFIVRTAQAGGRVWLLRAHDFHLCRVRTGDPWNLDRCRWLEMDRQRPTPLSGRYIFHAVWRDGHVVRGNRVLDEGRALDAGNNADEPTIVIIPR